MEMNDKLRPGYQSQAELWAVNPHRIARYMDNHVIPFLKLRKGSVCMDVGEANPRMEYMKTKLGLDVHQLATQDLNFDKIRERRKYDAIFVFDLLEHIQNALFLMSELKGVVKKNGSIYINLPENPRWLWGDEHYFELDRKHLTKWILNPLELRVVRQKKIFFIANWKAFFVGVRPLLRVLRGEQTLRSIMRSIFCFQFRIYEIKRTW